MATCKECLHLPVCELLRSRGERDAASFQLSGCDHFKDRSRFVELPCNPGDTVYVFDEIVDIDLCEKCPNFCWGGMGDPNECSKGRGGFRAPRCITISDETATLESIFWWLHIGAFGKSVFLSCEAAEKALAERKSNG